MANKQLSVTLPAELVDAIRALAERERRNLGQQVTILLEGAMRLRGPKNRVIAGSSLRTDVDDDADDAA